MATIVGNLVLALTLISAVATLVGQLGVMPSAMMGSLSSDYTAAAVKSTTPAGGMTDSVNANYGWSLTSTIAAIGAIVTGTVMFTNVVQVLGLSGAYATAFAAIYILLLAVEGYQIVTGKAIL